MKKTSRITWIHSLNIAQKAFFVSICLLPIFGLRADPQPLVQYDFNQPLDGAGKVVNIAAANDLGTDRGGILKSPGVIDQDMFDNTGSTMGLNDNSGGNVNTGAGFGSTTAFTITLWYKTDNPNGLSNNARLFDTAVGGKNFTLVTSGGAVGDLKIYSAASGAGNLIAETNPIYTDPNGGGISGQWIFIAVTYDGSTAGQSTISLYAGTDTESVSLVKSIVTSVSEVSGTQSLSAISFGGTSSGARAFSGYMDDIQVFTSYGSNSSGALTLPQLEAIRYQNLAIPEPASAVGIIGGLIGIFAILTVSRQHRSC